VWTTEPAAGPAHQPSPATSVLTTAEGSLVRAMTVHPRGRQPSATVELRGAEQDRERVLGQVVAGAEALLQPTGVPAEPGVVVLGSRCGARARVRIDRANNPQARPSDTFTVSLTLEAPGALSAVAIGTVLAAVERMPFTGLEWDELVGQMPLTHGLPGHLAGGCLAAVAPVFTVHHMTDFLVLVDAARRMGVPAAAITVIDKGYRYRHAQRVDAHLAASGISVWPWTRTAEALTDHVARAGQLGRAGLLVDDGGYTLPVLIEQRPGLVSMFVGLVEQTISGITKLERFGSDLPLPAFSVAQSRLKATIESYGVADAAVRNVLHLLPNESSKVRPHWCSASGGSGYRSPRSCAHGGCGSRCSTMPSSDWSRPTSVVSSPTGPCPGCCAAIDPC
jgi:adenosylhomocysteinase